MKKGRTRGKLTDRIINRTMIYLLICLVVFGAVFVFFGFGDASDGTRAGVPVKLSHKGWIWKTWEAELSVRGMLRNSEGFQPYIWDFSICDKSKEKIDAINDAIDEQKLIKITYSSPLVFPRWIQQSKYCVDRIEPMK